MSRLLAVNANETDTCIADGYTHGNARTTVSYSIWPLEDIKFFVFFVILAFETEVKDYGNCFYFEGIKKSISLYIGIIQSDVRTVVTLFRDGLDISGLKNLKIA